MALAETANLIVNLGLKGNFARDLSKTQRALGNFDARLDKSESRAYRFGQQIGTGIRRGATLAAGGLAFLAGNVAVGLNSLVELEQQVAQTNAVLKSTEGVAGITAEAVGVLAEKYETLNATIGDEVIRSSENLLLTFTNVREKAFEPTLAAILDMNTALGRGEGGLQQTTIQVGKAMQDPIRGITALRRAGVNFTKSQEKKIKSLIAEGKLYEAQQVILAELNKEFGGSFAAQGDTTAAKVAKFHDAIEDLQRTLAAGLLPVVSNVADALSKMLADPKVIADVEKFGKNLAGLFSQENLAKGARLLGDFFDAAREAAPGIISAAKIAGQVVATAVRLFQSLPPEIQKLAIGAFAINKLTGGIVTNVAGGLISAVLKQLVSGVVNVQGGVVNVNGGIGTGAGGAGGWMGSAKAAAAVLGPAIAVALASDFVTNETNKQGKTNFANPFAGGIGGNIVSAIHNLTEVVKLGQRQAADDRAHEGSGQRRTETTAAVDKVTTAVENLKGAAVPALGNVTDEVRANAAIVEAAQARTAGETQQTIIGSAAVTGALIGVGTATTRQQGTLTQSAVRTSASASASRIVGAIQRNRPITYVNVRVSATTVNKTTTVHTSYGPGGGSDDQNSRYGPVPT